MTANPGGERDQHGGTPTQRQRPIPADTLAVRLAIARMHAGHLTIREAADKCGLNYGSWSNWEQGARPRDLLGVVHAVSEGLDVDHDWILFGGPLAGPRGMPTRRSASPTHEYLRMPIRPKDNRPTGRATASVGASGPGVPNVTHPSRPEPRRPRRIK
jgi:hypothetical protein